MAWTVKPINRNGTLEISEDGEKIGTGRLHVSKAEPGMVTLTLHKKQRSSKVGRYTKHESEQFLTLRVPIDWVEALAELEKEVKTNGS